ncbi:MAG: hypothetical protein WBX21_03850 [Aestuariivirga sp.]
MITRSRSTVGPDLDTAYPHFMLAVPSNSVCCHLARWSIARRSGESCDTAKAG